jgi:group II intron reverse transcriptase/maturase
LGIAALEDKIVQQAVATVLNQIYEENFLGFSYGFRPGRGAHDALDALTVGIVTKKVNWILDADIRGFFDNISHEKLVELVELRVADRRVLRLIQKWLKAGVSEEGQWSETKVGTPQGAVISPLLANIYLHYVLDQWVVEWRKEFAHGDVIVVRYADDFVLGFQHRKEAERFVEQLRDRMAEYGLELHSEKTRLIQFGRFAAEDRKRDGAGKPETFDFLGFTHICGTTWKHGKFTVKRKTVGKRMRAKLQSIRAELRRRMHEPIEQTGTWLKQVVRGYFNYHAVPGNLPRLSTFRREVSRTWWTTLRRRSQRGRWTWERTETLVNRFLPSPRVLYPYP